MPRKKKRYGFVAELLVRHARTIFVLHVKKHGEQVSGVAAGSAPLVDDAVEDVFDKGDFALDAKIGERGHPMRNEQSAPEIGAEFQKQLQ